MAFNLRVDLGEKKGGGFYNDRQTSVKPGRNELCPCGSGKKYKKCCGNGQSTSSGAETVARGVDTAVPEAEPAAAEAEPAALGLETGLAEVDAAAAVDMGELVAMIRAGRFVDLETVTRSLIERNPNSGLAWKALSVSLTMQGKDALHAMTHAATLLPGDAEAHSNLGNALQSQRRFDDAAASYRRALEIQPHSPEGYNNLGSALRGLGRLDEAVASFRRALEIKADFAEASNNLGSALRGLRRFDEAVASYRRALEIKPRYPEAYNNLGNALFDQKQLDAAAASYRRALEDRPGFAEAHSNLGNALRGLGQLDEAAASYARALAIDPNFAGAHSNFGDVLRDLGRLAQAAASCRRAIELQPDLAGAHNSLGNALLDLGQFAEAAASYRRAVALRRDFAEAHINLGLVLRQQGRTAEAEACCGTALDLNPDSAPAVVLQAELQADNGRFAAAEELFMRAAALDPDLPEAWAGIAHLRKMTRNDAAWAVPAQRIAGQRLPPRREVYLRFAIGKYFDDVQDFGNAFINFQRAHELAKSYGPAYDRRQLTRAVDEMIQFYDTGWAARILIDPDASARPVFIVGMPRSGTTLAEQILASHPAVFGAGEVTYWTTAVSAERHAAAHGGAAAEYLKLLKDLSPDALRVIDKMPANFLRLGLIHEALPNARIIHMRRNPIDTCLSIYFQHFKTGHSYANDLDDLAHYYGEYLRLMEHWKTRLPEGAILEVAYESLVDDQETWSRKMLQFIGVPWDPRCIDFHRTDRSVMTASKWQVRQKMNRASIERWRNYEEFVGPLLTLAQTAPETAG
jgi:tetratricopeptide (TPR) repeat protein